MSVKKRNIALLTLIIAGELIFFLPFVLPRIFKPTLLEVFQISNTELGFFFSVYGFVAIGSYLIGGPLADRFPPRLLMSTALFLTAVGGLFLVTIPPSKSMFWIYGFWGVTTILLFWASMLKTTRLIGGRDSQGKAFGILDGGRGLVSALVATGGVWMLSVFMPANLSDVGIGEKTDAFKTVIWFFTGMVFLASVLVFIVFKRVEVDQNELSDRIQISDLLIASKKPEVWLQAFIILCAYSGYRVTDDFSLLTSDVLGYDDVQSARIGSLTLWLRPLAAITAGFAADRLKASSVSYMCFASMLIGGVLMVFLPEKFYSISLLAIIITSTCLGVYAMRGLYFAIMGEAKIPIGITGTVIGLASVIGYLPDIYMAPLMGCFLDKYPGEATGHIYVFMLLTLFSLLGIIATYFYKKIIRNKS